MASVDPQKALQEISQNQVDSVYFIVGEERYFSHRCLQQLRHTVVEEEFCEFNEEIFYCTEVKIERVVESLQTLPVMAERRLIILKEAQHLTEKDWGALDEVFELTRSSRSSVFVIQANQLDRRKKSIKRWLDGATVIDCQTPQEAARAPWIKSLAQSKGLDLDAESLAYLVRMGGNSLEELDQDLDKVFLFYGKPHRVTIGDLAQILQRNREENIFSLSESIGKKDRPQALFLYRRLKEQGESEIALVALIARHLRILLKTKKAQEDGMAAGPALAKKVGVNNYFLSQYTQQARLWTLEELAAALRALALMDKRLKSSSLPSELWMDPFIFWHGEGSHI